MGFQPGQVIADRYILDGEIGQGGIATVYKMHHVKLDTPFALKILRISTPSLKQRLELEAKVQAKIRHPNVVSVLDVIEEEGFLGLVMEFVEGTSLETLLQEERLKLEEVEEIFLAILDAMEEAHDNSIVHRDLKPGNIMLQRKRDRFQVKICDFGLAKALDDEVSISNTVSGATMGTPAYMAPEQVKNSKMVDQRADIFSLGAILYELISGRKAFTGSNTLEILNAVTEKMPPSIEEIVPNIPERYLLSIQGALQKQVANRIPSCRELREVLLGKKSWSLKVSDSLIMEGVDLMSGRYDVENVDFGKALEEVEKEEQRKIERSPKLIDGDLQREQKKRWDTQDDLLFEEMIVAWDKAMESIISRRVPGEKGLNLFYENFQKREASRTWGERHSKVKMLLDVAKEKKISPEYQEWLQIRAWDDGNSLIDVQRKQNEQKLRIQELELQVNNLSWWDGLFQKKTLEDTLEKERRRSFKLDERYYKLEHKIEQYMQIFSSLKIQKQVPLPKNNDQRRDVATDLILLPKGEFLMGAASNDDAAQPNERPQHKVILTRDFYLGKYPVTQRLWEKVMDYNPSWFSGYEHPVEQVTWFDCIEFCNKLSELEGLEKVYTIQDRTVHCNWNADGYRLPTEAEWAYAMKGKNEYKYSGSDDANSVAWWRKNSQEGTRPVGLKAPNNFGLYDMSGNVWEWCWDGKEKYVQYECTDPAGNPTEVTRMLRGGCWDSGFVEIRTSSRKEKGFLEADLKTGFRVARCAY